MSWNPDGACRSFVSFDASSGTPTISLAYNCTITDDGVGLFTLNFAVAMAADYVCVGCARHNASPAASTSLVSFRRQLTDCETTTTCAISIIYDNTPSSEDSPECAVWIAGCDA